MNEKKTFFIFIGLLFVLTISPWVYIECRGGCHGPNDDIMATVHQDVCTNTLTRCVNTNGTSQCTYTDGLIEKVNASVVPLHFFNPLITSFTIQTIGPSGPSNQFYVTVSGVNSTTNAPSIYNEHVCNFVRTDFALLIFAILLYLCFYCIATYFTIVSYHAFRRKCKLICDIHGVLGALGEEPDKKRRQAMQKKILDDMIDTYLDKPTSED